MRIVLDTNVFVAAFAAHGVCEAVVELCLDRYEMGVSEALLAEVRPERIGETRIVTPGVFARLQSEGPAEHRRRRSR